MRFGTIKFLTTTALTDQSRVIIRNGLMARLQAAAPFLTFDREPYMVIAGGRLYWIADAYTTTGRIPYSQPLDGVNYIRNSVKVVVDAYNGSMRFYAFDQRDPIIRAYERLFPGMFRPASTMDATLRAHVRYPQDYFRAQAALFGAYHVTDPVLLYNKGNQWQVPVGVSISGAGEMNPYYMIMRLPGQTREEFVLIMPFTPNGRTNMIGWLGAESDAPHYGKAVSFEFPSNLSVYGPAQVEAAVNQDPIISAQRTLWGQHGSSVIFGNLIVVPIENSLLYVQPLYLQAEADAPAAGAARHRVLSLALGDARPAHRASSRTWSWRRRWAAPWPRSSGERRPGRRPDRPRQAARPAPRRRASSRAPTRSTRPRKRRCGPATCRSSAGRSRPSARP